MKKKLIWILTAVAMFVCLFQNGRTAHSSEGFLGTTGSRYYYNTLNETQKQLYSQLYTMSLDFANSDDFLSLDLSIETTFERGLYAYVNGRVSSTDCEQAKEAFEMDNPQFFFVSPSNPGYDAENNVTKIRFNLYNYYYSAQHRTEAYNAIKFFSKEWNKAIEKEKDPFRKVMVIHELIIKQVEYDDEAVGGRVNYEYAHSIGGVFSEKQVVCEGYGKALHYMCMLNGIESVCISGMGSSESHLWNAVRLDGKWYYVDATWDDAGSEASSEVRYKYFLVTKEPFETDHSPYHDLAYPDITSGSAFEFHGAYKEGNYSDFIDGVLSTTDSDEICLYFASYVDANRFALSTNIIRKDIYNCSAPDSVLVIYDRSALEDYVGGTHAPTQIPTSIPTEFPTTVPTQTPTQVPTQTPSPAPSSAPTQIPTQIPTSIPTEFPTTVPTQTPTQVPTQTPSPVPSPSHNEQYVNPYPVYSPVVSPVPSNPYISKVSFKEQDYTIWSLGNSKNRSVKIKASITPQSYYDKKGKKHDGKLIWRVSSTKITPVIKSGKVKTKNDARAAAVVNQKGKVTVKGTNSGIVYVYACDAQSGKYEEFKVLVRQAPRKIVIGLNDGQTISPANQTDMISLTAGTSKTLFLIPYISKDDTTDADCTYTVSVTDPSLSQYVTFTQPEMSLNGYITFTVSARIRTEQVVQLKVSCSETQKGSEFLFISIK